jgi:hypothetical protein
MPSNLSTDAQTLLPFGCSESQSSQPLRFPMVLDSSVLVACFEQSFKVMDSLTQLITKCEQSWQWI